MNTHFFHNSSNKRYMLRRSHSCGRRRGSTLLLVALGITVFLGAGALSIDYGILVNDKNVMQRSCDAAALAGVSRLKMTNDAYDTVQASNLAIDVARRNGTTITASNITFLDSNRTIRVTSNSTRSLFFGRFLGRTNAAVAARATATLKGVDHLVTGYVKPIGITWETYNAYKNDQANYRDLTLIRQNKEVFEKDDYVLFDLRDSNGASPAQMENQLTGAAQEMVSIGDFERTLNAATVAQRKKFTDGLDTLMNRAKGSPWFDNGPTLPSNPGGSDTYQPSAAYSALVNGTMSYDNPRVLNIIITPSTERANNGLFNTEVQGFVPVYIEGYYTRPGSTATGNPNEIELVMRVRFLPPAASLPGQGTTTTGGSLSGLRTISLIE